MPCPTLYPILQQYTSGVKYSSVNYWLTGGGLQAAGVGSCHLLFALYGRAKKKVKAVAMW